MAIGHGILFLSYFTTRDAIHLRGVHRELRQLVTNFAWDNRDPESHVGAIKLWRTCFPRAVACTLRPWRVQLTDLLELRGVRFLDMSGSLNVTDTGFTHWRVFTP